MLTLDSDTKPDIDTDNETKTPTTNIVTEKRPHWSTVKSNSFTDCKKVCIARLVTAKQIIYSVTDLIEAIKIFLKIVLTLQ